MNDYSIALFLHILSGSLITIAVAIVLGLASALHMPRRERAQVGSAG